MNQHIGLAARCKALTVRPEEPDPSRRGGMALALSFDVRTHLLGRPITPLIAFSRSTHGRRRPRRLLLRRGVYNAQCVQPYWLHAHRSTRPSSQTNVDPPRLRMLGFGNPQFQHALHKLG